MVVVLLVIILEMIKLIEKIMLSRMIYVYKDELSREEQQQQQRYCRSSCSEWPAVAQSLARNGAELRSRSN